MSGFRMRNTIDALFVDEYANTRSIENLLIYRPGAPGNGDTLIFNTATNTWGYGPGGTGVTGAIGPTGAIGRNTNTGPTGYTGPTGTRGFTGPRGLAGTASYTGATGPTGTRGFTGPRGLAGTASSTGATGPIGQTGYTGATGATGPRGLAGTASSTGATGATGKDGLAGSTGATGPKGDTGKRGEKGDPGTGSVEITSATITASVSLVAATLKDIYFITQTSTTTCVITLPEMSTGVFKIITFVKNDDFIYDIQIKSHASDLIMKLCPKSTGHVVLVRPTVRIINYENPSLPLPNTQWMTI